jgi:hypothetical protein
VVLELSDARFGELVDGVRRATREEIFKGTGIHKATRRILDPVRRRQTAAQRLHTWLEEDPGGGEDVAFRLLYDVLSGLLRPLVVDFLDACEIPHEDGMTDGLTRLNDAEASDLVGTVADLAEKHPHGDLALYLYFTAADPDFDALATTLEKVDGLRAALGS